MRVAGDATVKLAEICRDVKINPRAARMKLRASKDKFPDTVGESWTWKTQDAAKVKELLTAAKEK